MKTVNIKPVLSSDNHVIIDNTKSRISTGMFIESVTLTMTRTSARIIAKSLMQFQSENSNELKAKAQVCDAIINLFMQEDESRDETPQLSVRSIGEDDPGF